MRSDLLLLAAVGVVIFAVSAAAGAVVGAGLFVGLVLVGLVYLQPMVGLGLMLLAGTALQVLGSEHIIRLPLSLGKIAGVVTLAAWLARTVVHRTPLTYTPQLPALAAFTLCLVVSTLASEHPMAREGLFRYLQLFLLFFMIVSIAGQSTRLLDAACLSLTACMLVSSIIGLMEFFLPSLAIESDDPSLVQGAIGAIVDRDSLDGVEIKRITGGLSDSNWFAYTLVAVLPLNLYLWRRYAAIEARLFILTAAALQSVGIVLSFTRSALIGVAAVVLVLTLRRRLAAAPVLLCAVLAVGGVVAWNPPGLQRLFSVEYLREGSTPLRSYLLRGAVALVQERPLLGFGYSQFGPAFHSWLRGQQVDDSVATWEQELEKRVAAGEEQFEWVMPHNTVLQIWVEFGLFGLLSFAAVFLFCLHDLAVARRFGTPPQRLLSDCLLAGFVGLLVCTLFGHLALLKILWIIPGFAAALRRVALAPGEPERAPVAIGRPA